MKLKLAMALGALMVSGAANAQLTGVQVNGTLTFNNAGPNYFLPSNFFVPAGYGNSSGLPVTIGSGTEFGFNDTANLDTANFTDTQLIITDVTVSGAALTTMTFTSLTPGAFAGLSLVSSNLSGLTYGLVGDTITVSFNLGNIGQSGTYSALFNIAPAGVPEPATWAMMLLGFGATGIALRRSRRPAQQLA